MDQHQPKPSGRDSALSRRLFVFRSLAGAATIAMSPAVVVATSSPAQAQRCTDRDANDAFGRGRRCGARGCTDRDSTDAFGRGRRCGRPRRCTDRDANDGFGRGRRC